MMTDSSAEARKVDRKTAQALWDSSVLPTGLRKKRIDEPEEEESETSLTESYVVEHSAWFIRFFYDFLFVF